METQQTSRTPIDYLLIGHMTADLRDDERVIGGTVSYAARAATAFGLRVGVLTSAAADDPLIEQLRPYVESLVVVPADETSTFENIYINGARQQMIRGVASSLSPDDLLDEWLDVPLVHIASLTGELDPTAFCEVFPNATKLLTAQGLLRRWGADGRVLFKRWADEQALRLLDWLVLSEEDIAGAPDLEHIYAEHSRNFVLTRSDRGGTYYRDGNAYHYSTPTVQNFHPTGAGDVFAAALLIGFYRFDGNVKQALQLAAAAGALAVTRYGWEGAPTPLEAEQLLQEVEQHAD